MNTTEKGLPFTTPTLLCVTEPHLYFGVVTVGFTLTLSPIFIWDGELCGGNPGSASNERKSQRGMERHAALDLSLSPPK